MRKIRNIVIAFAMALGIAAGVTACSPEPVDVGAETVIIDVRTPEEFASGHLEGAININWQGDFAAGVSELPTDGEYLLYCRSGSRAGEALKWMESSGYSNVTNLGSVAEASSATSIPVVQ